MFWAVSTVGILKQFIMVTWGVNIVEKSTTVINACHIRRLSEEKNYELLFKGLFSQTWFKAHKMIRTILVRVVNCNMYL